MNPELLLAHFTRISNAPDAISRLRGFILDLAVRGKLVEQDPNDETGYELLRRIQVEKARLVKSGVIRAQKPLAVVEDCNLFHLPDGWAWTRWESIALKIGDIDHKMPETVADGLPFVSPRDFLPGNRIDFDGAKRVSLDDFARLSKKMKPAIGDLIYPRYGTIGENRLVTEARDFLVSYSCAVIKALVGFIDPQYQYLYSVSSFCREQAREAENKTTQANVGIKSIQEFVVPLPPLAEQHRIVAKVDELMALCDRLEGARAERETQRDRLAAASHYFLNNGVSAEDFPAHAHFYINHLPSITTRPEQIPALRRTILSLAVRGQLVLQDPDDEPASSLLKRIQAEKASMIKEGLLRKEKPLPAVADDEVPFAIPTTWRWARIGTCSLLTDYGTSVKSDQVPDGVPILAMGNIQDGQLVLNDRRKVPHGIDDLPHLFLKRFDLLYNRTNSAELVGKTGIYLGDDDAYTFASYLIRIRFFNNLTSPLYANLAMNAPYFRATQIVPELQQQCGQANVNGSKLRNMLIPLPPLAGQHRIVAKVDKLMAVCDRLETQLTTAQAEASRLLEAVLHQSLAEAS